MRKVLCLALVLAALIPFAGSRPVAGCSDWDEDGVCAENDCNDFNPTVGYNGDADQDGIAVCQGDCDDGDASNVDKCMGFLQMYPVIYQPPEQPCRDGFIITTSFFNCWIDAYGTRICETQPFYQYDTPYLRDCY